MARLFGMYGYMVLLSVNNYCYGHTGRIYLVTLPWCTPTGLVPTGFYSTTTNLRIKQNSWFLLYCA